MIAFARLRLYCVKTCISSPTARSDFTSPSPQYLSPTPQLSALEYALLSEVPRDIFRMLQKSCAKERKRRDEKAKKARAREASLRLTAEAQQAAANIAAQQTSDAITELAAINMAAKNVKLSSRRQVFAADVHNSTRTLNRTNSSSNESIRSLTGRAA